MGKKILEYCSGIIQAHNGNDKIILFPGKNISEIFLVNHHSLFYNRNHS